MHYQVRQAAIQACIGNHNKVVLAFVSLGF